MQKSKDSFEDCFENVNILKYTGTVRTDSVQAIIVDDIPVKMTSHTTRLTRSIRLSLKEAASTSLESDPEVIKLFSCSTQLSTIFQLLIKTKIPTNEEVSRFKSIRCCIYHAYKC